MMDNPSSDVEIALLCTLKTIIKKISLDPILQETLKDICDTVKGNLLPDSKLFDCSTKFVFAIAEASEQSSSFVCQEIAPILLNLYKITKNVKHKTAYLIILVNLFHIFHRYHEKTDVLELKSVPTLCLKVCIEEQDGGYKIAALESLGRISKFLPLDVRICLYDNFRLLLITPFENNIRNTILTSLKQISLNFPEEVTSQLLKKIIIDDNPATLRLYFEVLTTLAPSDNFTNYTIDTLLDYMSNEPSLVIKSLKKLLETNVHHETIQSELIDRNIVAKLIDFTLNQSDDSKIPLEVLLEINAILKYIMTHLDEIKQIEVVREHFDKITQNHERISYIFVLEGLLNRLRQNFTPAYQILDILTEKALKGDLIGNISCQLVSNLINKCHDGKLSKLFLALFSQFIFKIWSFKLILIQWKKI